MLKPTQNQLYRRRLICCKMYLEQKDYKGLSNHILMHDDYKFFQLVEFLILNKKYDELTSFFNQMIIELE